MNLLLFGKLTGCYGNPPFIDLPWINLVDLPWINKPRLRLFNWEGTI